MMFNGLLMYGDSDCSDFFKESTGASSLAESVSEAERARCLEDKLHATLQILKNKEETVRVQAESLALAEERISSLASKVPSKLNQGTQIQALQKGITVGCKTEMTDVSISAETHESNGKIVKTLRDNLTVIEDLYRECFYETAKQEQLIEMLRRSYLELRVTDKQKNEQIGRLQYVVDTQRSSLQTYQEIAVEVENLKAEISNFLSSSNNDSGECTCGLEEENKKLRRQNEINEVQISKLQQRVIDLEEALEDKENIDDRYQRQIQEKEYELNRIRQQLYNLEKSSQEECCERLTAELKDVKGLLDEKTTELAKVQQKCQQHEATIDELKETLEKSNVNAKDSVIHAEVVRLSAAVRCCRSQLRAARRRLRALQADLRSAREHCHLLQTHYREQSNCAHNLQAQLEEAQARGAALCDETRHIVCTVRRCLKQQSQRQRDQEERIKQQETLIRTLQSSQTESALNEPCCSKSLHMRCASETERGCGRSVSETGSAPPTPPRRLLRKKQLKVETPCNCSVRHVSVSQTRRSEDDCTHGCNVRYMREVSPDELLERVERAHEALALAHRRWGAHAARARTDRSGVGG
ncbi:COP1-interactive protein 1-like [Colias croceus]|uniref:COP1-interactive protein 1-like n=1 Tax=Colias crocea TaxID=72248 RepID=UPI001E27ADE5|nr:COP1-interactive protein 1-like [Colias croceus]